MAIEFNCNRDSVSGNNINDAAIGLDNVPSGFNSTDQIFSVDTIVTSCALSQVKRRVPATEAAVVISIHQRLLALKEPPTEEKAKLISGRAQAAACWMALHQLRWPILSKGWVEANSTSGSITYDGDLGRVGNYRLSSLSGDVDVSIPEIALVDILINRQTGQNSNESATPTTRPNSLFLRPASVSRAHFELRSFMGKVRLKRP